MEVMRIELTTYAPCQTPAVTVRVRRSSLPDDPLLETMLSPHSHQVVDAPCSPIDPEHEQRAHTRRCVPVVSSGLEWEKLTARSKRTVQPAPYESGVSELLCARLSNPELICQITPRPPLLPQVPHDG